jgi:hypothetical protein
MSGRKKTPTGAGLVRVTSAAFIHAYGRCGRAVALLEKEFLKSIAGQLADIATRVRKIEETPLPMGTSRS